MAAYFGHDVDGHVDMLANSEGRWELTVTNKLCLPKIQTWRESSSLVQFGKYPTSCLGRPVGARRTLAQVQDHRAQVHVLRPEKQPPDDGVGHLISTAAVLNDQSRIAAQLRQKILGSVPWRQIYSA